VSVVLVDSNVIIDVAVHDPIWGDWSAGKLVDLRAGHVLVINAMVYAEVAVSYTRPEDLETVLPLELFRREHLPWDAAFLAGRCYREYRRRGGARRSPLPDFFIGAHAAVMGYRLLTRDTTRYRSYFPTVELIAP
jgi:predicted nucleic acid-binding protein